MTMHHIDTMYVEITDYDYWSPSRATCSRREVNLSHKCLNNEDRALNVVSMRNEYCENPSETTIFSNEVYLFDCTSFGLRVSAHITATPPPAFSIFANDGVSGRSEFMRNVRITFLEPCFSYCQYIDFGIMNVQKFCLLTVHSKLQIYNF